MLLLMEQKETVEVICNDANYGIAKALNIGVEKAISNGYEWVMTLDQDSTASPGMIDEMSKVYNLIEDKRSVGIICPRLYDKNKKGFIIEDCSETDTFMELNVAIQSGSLMNAEVFHRIGYFCEPLFIYYVDVEFSMRVKRNGLKIYQCNNAILLHEEGKKKKKTLLYKEYYYNDYNENAVYYIARNSIYMLKAYKENKKSYIRRLKSDLIMILIFDDRRIKKLGYYFKGILDGLRSRYGKLS